MKTNLKIPCEFRLVQHQAYVFYHKAKCADDKRGEHQANRYRRIFYKCKQQKPQGNNPCDEPLYGKSFFHSIPFTCLLLDESHLLSHKIVWVIRESPKHSKCKFVSFCDSEELNVTENKFDAFVPMQT